MISDDEQDEEMEVDGSPVDEEMLSYTESEESDESPRLNKIQNEQIQKLLENPESRKLLCHSQIDRSLTRHGSTENHRQILQDKLRSLNLSSQVSNTVNHNN